MTSIHGRFARAETLLGFSSEVDAVDKEGFSALHIASRYGHELLVRSLISAGARINRFEISTVESRFLLTVFKFLDVHRLV